MPRYDIRCKGEGAHVKEVAFSTFGAAGEAFEAGIACDQCGSDTEQIITTVPGVLYNASGFYGSVPTADAHATGLV